MPKKYHTYIGIDGKRTNFTVFIIHGHSNDWKKIKKYIEDKLKFKVKVLLDSYAGTTIIDKLRRAIWEESDCAVAIMSADDLLVNETKNPRPNVLLEIGYTQGFFDHLYWYSDKINPVVLLKEDLAAIPSDLNGVEYLEYSQKTKISKVFPQLKQALENLYKQVKKYYEPKKRK